MKFDLNLRRQNIDDNELLDDIVRVQSLIKKKMTKKIYNEKGIFYSSTIEKRFGSWNNAKIRAGILDVHNPDISVLDLLKNIEKLWISLGRQPKADELIKPLSDFSITPYKNKFGSWNNALSEFINFVVSDHDNSIDNVEIHKPVIDNKKVVHKTKREISDRLRFRILMRDGFACQSCGRSPQLERGVELHVDHIKPYSKGGETVIENLQTKCKKCNLGKGNAFEV